MILGQDGAKAGTCKIGPGFPEEVVYMTPDHLVQAVEVLQPGTYDWFWDEDELTFELVVGAKR